LKIKLFSPLDRILGPMKELHFTDSVSVAEVLRSLIEETPDFAPYAGFGPKDVHPYALLVWRDGKVLKLSDALYPTDEVEMLLMVPGG
jgi:hypothetical protein